MNNFSLTAISPIDGRYMNATKELSDYFSEFALIKYRYKVEVEYFIFLAEKKFFKLKSSDTEKLRQSVSDFSIVDAQEIKEIEKITNHDVKAVEYFLKKKTDLYHKLTFLNHLISQNLVLLKNIIKML